MALDILDVVQLGGERVIDIDDNDLPVSLVLVEESHDTEDLDLLDLAGVADKLTNLADVERVVVTLGLGLGVDCIGVLPGLDTKWCQSWCSVSNSVKRPYLREGAVVPEVALVGEAVADVAELSLLDILLNGVEGLLLGDLLRSKQSVQAFLHVRAILRAGATYLKLGIGPAGDLNNHVEDGLLLVGVQRDIVERRDGHAILLDVDAVLEGVRGSDLAKAVLRSHGCGCSRGVCLGLCRGGNVASNLEDSLRCGRRS